MFYRWNSSPNDWPAHHGAPLENTTLHVAELPGPATVVTRDLHDQLMGKKQR